MFTSRDLEARAWLKKLTDDAGFAVREDAVGNTFLRWEGLEPTLPAVGTGSHTDAIPHAGMYDGGTVGVLGGLEAMRSLQEAGFKPKRSIETLMFTSEEPTRFGIGCIGSRLLGGVIDPVAADALHDRLPETEPSAREGLTLQQVREGAGFHGDLAGVKLPRDYYSAWVELHIEQGPRLDREGIQLGIVTGIAAPASYRYAVDGFGGHAGALLMPYRRDALCAAAEMILSVERHALAANAASGGVDTVATVGTVAVHPGAVNSVPSRVTLMLDIRDTDVARRNSVMAAFHADIAEIEHRRRRQNHRGTRSTPTSLAQKLERTSLKRSNRYATPRAATYKKNGEPRVPRLELHGPRRADRDDLHPLPQRRLASPRRVLHSRRDLGCVAHGCWP